jgi:hypothetical protein
VRTRLQASDARVRLAAAWELGANALLGPVGAAFGFGNVEDNGARGEPEVLRRRIFPLALAVHKDIDALLALATLDTDPMVRANAGAGLARVATSDRSDVYAALMGLARLDPEEIVRLAVVSNASTNSPQSMRDDAREWLHDASREVQSAAVAKLREWTPDVSAFVRMLHGEPVESVIVGLDILRQEGAPLAWRDVAAFLPAIDGALAACLVPFFEERLADPPIAFWLSCVEQVVAHFKRPEQREDLEAIIGDALWLNASRGSFATAAGNPDAALLDVVLTGLTQRLSFAPLGFFLDLKQNRGERPRNPLSRIWFALLRLSPQPTKYRPMPGYR